jgi:hypothetical protein
MAKMTALPKGLCEKCMVRRVKILLKSYDQIAISIRNTGSLKRFVCDRCLRQVRTTYRIRYPRKRKGAI